MHQVRLDKKTRLRDIAKDLLAGVETAMAREMKAPGWGSAAQRKLAQLIRKHLEHAVRAYSVCGEQPRCHLQTGHVGSGDWNQPPVQASQQILLLEQSLANLSISLTAEIFDRFFPHAADTVWLKMKPELDQVIDESLKPVMYENPYCDNCPLCNEKTRCSSWTLKKPKAKTRKG